MSEIFLVTGNKNKLAEWQRLVPSNIDIESVDIDLTEIQSIDSEEIVADKAKRAFEAVGKPVVIEDVSAGLEKLGGLPGPFIKFFMNRMGSDVLMQLADDEGDKATVSCSVAYFDGTELFTVKGEVHGTVVRSRGDSRFGFDNNFMPDGQTKTYGEMTLDEKDLVSHRSRAIKLFIEALHEYNNKSL